MSYDNPSQDDLDQFRKTLLNQMLFEPTTDPGFVRPAEKLHFLVHQSGEMIAKLRRIVDTYDKLQANVSKAQKILDDQKPCLDVLQSLYINVPSVCALQEMQLRQEAGNLCLQFIPLDSEPVKLKAEWSISQLLAAQVWLFLEQSGSAVTKGTEQFFPTQGPPSSLGDLFYDGIDEIVKEVGLPAVTPLMHIFKAIFDFIRRQEASEEKSDAAYAGIKLHSFLLSYFAWWTEGGGSSTIEGIVKECANRQRIHLKAGQAFTTKGYQFIQALQHFDQNLDSLQSGKQQTA